MRPGSVSFQLCNLYERLYLVQYKVDDDQNRWEMTRNRRGIEEVNLGRVSNKTQHKNNSTLQAQSLELPYSHMSVS